MRRKEISCPYCGTYNPVDPSESIVICEFCERDIPLTSEAQEEKKNTIDSKPAELTDEERRLAEAALGINKKEENVPADIDKLFEKIVQEGKTQFKKENFFNAKNLTIGAVISLIIIIIMVIAMISLFHNYLSVSDQMMNSLFTPIE